jgi:hypothetical protein
MTKKLIVLMLLLFSVSCGKIEHEVTGGADVNFNFNLEQIESYFLALCESNHDPDPELCAKAQTAEFIKFMMTMKED